MIHFLQIYDVSVFSWYMAMSQNPGTLLFTQNSWDSWMLIPPNMLIYIYIGFDTSPYENIRILYDVVIYDLIIIIIEIMYLWQLIISIYMYYQDIRIPLIFMIQYHHINE